MWLNNYSVRIPQGAEKPGGYIELTHGDKYMLVLRNSRSERCDARVEIDGKHVGTWRIPAYSSIDTHRPAHDSGCFTFYKVGTQEAQQAGLVEGDPNLGLVRVVFTPEKVVEVKRLKPMWEYCSPGGITYTTANTTGDQFSATYACASTPTSSGHAAGGTGLSGHSNQTFGQACGIEYDLSQQTVIHLRLVARNGDVRPLTAFSTPVPPPVR